MGEAVSIWSSVEVDAWSRDFDYTNYLNLHKQLGVKGSALHIDAYDAFYDLMDIIYEDSLK